MLRPGTMSVPIAMMLPFTSITLPLYFSSPAASLLTYSLCRPPRQSQLQSWRRPHAFPALAAQPGVAPCPSPFGWPYPDEHLGSKTQPHSPQQAIKTRPPKTVEIDPQNRQRAIGISMPGRSHRAPMGILLGRLAQDKGRREKIPLANFQVIGYNKSQLLYILMPSFPQNTSSELAGHQVCGVGRSRLCSHAW